ncbi:MAG: hypothetical protein LBP87_06055 [Planctomycetaceae bacterium]|nr:hypothetical protein [Planctomycetaceae bacterium]
MCITVGVAKRNLRIGNTHPNFSKPCKGEIMVVRLIISPHAGLCLVLSGFRRFRFATPTVMHNPVPVGLRKYYGISTKPRHY